MSTPLAHPRALAFAALALAAVVAGPARAADLDEPYAAPHRPGVEAFPSEPRPFPPPPPRAFAEDDGRAPEEVCRVFVKHRPGPFGDEVRRVRVCDEGPSPVRFAPRWEHGWERGWHGSRNGDRDAPRGEDFGGRPPVPPEFVPGE